MPPKNVELKLAQLTREFFARNPGIKLVAVTGSTGKTSAKIAIGTVLSQQYNVQLREEDPKTRAEVFLQIMGVLAPEDNSNAKWKTVIEAVEQRVNAKYPEVQVIVQEFSPSKPGDNEWFRDYLIPDITVVTAVNDGRMQVEYPVEEVAKEMISLANNSKTALINRDDVEGRFSGFLINPHISTYGVEAVAEYHFENHDFEIGSGYHGLIVSPENQSGLEVTIDTLGQHNIRPAVAAAAIGYKMGMKEELIASGIGKIHSVPGRMNVFRGGNGSWIIDDSYSSSPSTALSALQTLYSLDTPQRIAVFGNMNGLRGVHEKAHQQLGGYCNIEMLDWVVTVGGRANLFLAPEARRNGCQVKECVDAIEAGAFVREKLQEGGIALFKGSSGGVWLEEAVKLNLLSATDSSQLVRQQPELLEKKQAFFTANRSGDGETINSLGINEMEDEMDDQQQSQQPEPQVQPQQTPPQGYQTPAINNAVQSSGKRSKKKLIVGSILGGAGLLLIIAAVLTYFLWWQNPNKMITDALANAMNAKQMSAVNKVEISSPEVDMSIDLDMNYDGEAMGGAAKLVIKSKDLPKDLEFKLNAISDKDGATYLKLVDIDKVVDTFVEQSVNQARAQYEDGLYGTSQSVTDEMMAEQEAMIRSMIDPMVEKVNNKWLKFTPESFKESNEELSCTNDVISKFQKDKAMQDEVVNAYKQNQFMIVKEKVESKNGSTGFEMDLTSAEFKNKSKGFADALKTTSIVKQLEECDEGFSVDSDADSHSDDEKDITYSMKVWVRPWTHQLTSIEFAVDQPNEKTGFKLVSDMKMGESNKVELPNDAEDGKTVMEEVLGGFFAQPQPAVEDELFMFDDALVGPSV